MTHDQAVIDYAVSVMTSSALWTALDLYLGDGYSRRHPWPVAMIAELQRRGEAQS